MQGRFSRMLAGVRDLVGLVDQNSAKLVEVNSGGARDALNEAVEQLAAHATAQEKHRIGRKGEIDSERQRVEAFRRKHVAPIVRVSQTRVPEVAQLEAVRTLPAQSSSTQLVTAALAIADAVTPYVTQLCRAGLPADFLDRLRGAASQLLGSVASKSAHRRQQVGATDAIDKQVDELRRVVTATDSLVRAELDRDDPLVKEWASIVRRVRRALQSPSQAPQPEVGTTAGAAVPVPAPAAVPAAVTALVAVPKAAA